MEEVLKIKWLKTILNTCPVLDLIVPPYNDNGLVHPSKRDPGPDMAMKKYKAQVVLGEDSHVMQWNPALQIFR